MEDLQAGARVEAHQEVVHEVTVEDDVGEGPLSNSCLSAIKYLELTFSELGRF